MDDCDENQFAEEEKLLEQLKTNCKTDGTEIDPHISAPIFHKLAILYLQRSKICNTVSECIIRLTRSAALLNAALVRITSDANDIKYSLKELHQHLLETAEAHIKDADLFDKANHVKRSIEEMRSFVDKQLVEISKIEADISESNLNEKELNKIKAIESLQNKITADYTEIMSNLANYCEQIMGKAPCKFAIVGLGSLARKEITPFSDFEHQIVIDSKFDDKDETISNYFRWYSVIFQIILINLGETTISSLLNTASSKFGSWFFDDVTKCGISFSGELPWACAFSLGRQQVTVTKDGKTQLIKFLPDLLKYRPSQQILKNAYHSESILTNVCYVYGDQSVYRKSESCVDGDVLMQNGSLADDVLNQVKHNLENFAVRSVLLKVNDQGKCNVEKDIYCATTLFMSALGKLNHISTTSGFEIVRKLADKTVISNFAKHKLMHAIAIACELRLRWYMMNKKRKDEINTEDANSIVGKRNAISYFQTAYALQCDISKRYGLKKKHYYSHPSLLNISIYSSFKSDEELENCIKAFEASSKEQRLLEFDEVMKMLTTSSPKCNSTQTSNINIDGNGKEVLCGMFFMIGRELLEMSKLIDAKEYLEKSLKIKQQLSSDLATDKDMAMILHETGRCSMKLRKHTEAKNYFGKALKIKKKIASDFTNDREMADTLYEIGGCLINMKNLTDAKACLEKALEINQELPKDIDTEKNMSDILYEIGRCLIVMNQPIEAKNALQKALKIKQQLPKGVTCDKDEADTFYLIGRCLIEMNNLADAGDHFEKAVKIKQLLISDDFPTENDMADNLHNIGKYLYFTDKLADAKDYLEKALSIKQEISSDVDADVGVAISLLIIGRCLVELNEPVDARNHLQKALKILLQISSDEKNWENTQKVEQLFLSNDVFTNQLIAVALNEIGQCLMRMLEFVDAKQYLERALDIQKQISNDVACDREIALTLYKIGQCLYWMNKFTDANECLQKTLKMQHRISSDVANDGKVAHTFHEIGRCLIKMKKHADAKQHLKEALEIQQRISSDLTTDADLAHTLHDIGRCLIGMNKLAEAKNHLKRALEIRQQISSDSTTDLSIAYTFHEIGRCLGEMYKLTEAKDYLERSLEIKQRISNDVATDGDVAFALLEIGRCLMKMNKLTDAKDCMDRALEISLRISSDIATDRSVAYTLLEIGRCLMKMNKLIDAKDYMDRALEINQRISNDIATERNVACTLLQTGRCLMKMNKLIDAKNYMDRALEIKKRISCDIATDRNVAFTLLEIGRCLMKMNKFVDAKDYLERALEIQQRTSSDHTCDQNVAVTMREIDRCINKMNKLDDVKKPFGKRW